VQERRNLQFILFGFMYIINLGSSIEHFQTQGCYQSFIGNFIFINCSINFKDKFVVNTS